MVLALHAICVVVCRGALFFPLVIDVAAHLHHVEGGRAASEIFVGPALLIGCINVAMVLDAAPVAVVAPPCSPSLILSCAALWSRPGVLPLLFLFAPVATCDCEEDGAAAVPAAVAPPAVVAPATGAVAVARRLLLLVLRELASARRKSFACRSAFLTSKAR